jgi:hypothetical protein
MPKTDLRDILVHGEDFKLKRFNAKEFNSQTRYLQEYLKICRERKRYDKKFDNWIIKNYSLN